MVQMITCFVDLFLFKKKKISCDFIDYKKAFYSVDRAVLWHKQLTSSVDVKILNLIRNM